jgi:acetyl-CoA carboxylase alpha subunit
VRRTKERDAEMRVRVEKLVRQGLTEDVIRERLGCGREIIRQVRNAIRGQV